MPASELHAEALSEDAASALESGDGTSIAADGGVQYDVVVEDGDAVVRSNRLTMDDPSRQKLSMEEIEELKKSGAASGKDIIAKIMQSHTGIDEKTAFSLAKYTLRKTKKYLRRFTILPLDVSMLASYILNEKDAAKILELREESLGLMASWSNVHYSGPDPAGQAELSGRWLVVDDTGGLIVALLAERMGILHPSDQTLGHNGDDASADLTEAVSNKAIPEDDMPEVEADPQSNYTNASFTDGQTSSLPPKRTKKYPEEMSATHDTITLLHAAGQPNISLLSYFSYTPNESSATANAQTMNHPLYTHLKTLSWLQLIEPEADAAYQDFEVVPDDALQGWKSSKRGTYHRKRRRWERTRRVVDETRAGGFDGLIVASTMAPASILHHAVPLLKGGAQIVVFSPNVEPLSELTDYYSSNRRAAFLNDMDGGASLDDLTPTEDYPVDPRLLLFASLQTARAREYQILPGRMHPLMTSRGGAEGYLFTATRAVPVEGKIEARGRFTKKRKLNSNSGSNTPQSGPL